MKNLAYRFLSLLAAGLVLAGCANQPKPAAPHYQTITPEPGRNTELALKCNDCAARHIDKKQWSDAEKQLKLALAADDSCAPAHNNLGKVYFEQKKMYLAAIEFQAAAKLMPAAAPPRNNLGLVYEAVGELEKAAASYEEALRLSPCEMEATANLARVDLRMNRKDQRTRELLRDVALRDSRPEWSNWARKQLAVGWPESQPSPAPALPASSQPEISAKR